MSSDPSTFDEVAFKQMVRRAWGCECCPPGLRSRIESAVEPAREQVQEPPVSSTGRMRIGWTWGLSAAALVAVALGVGALRQELHANGVNGASPAVAVVPVSLQHDLVATHDRCSQKADHHRLPGVLDNDAAIAAVMRQQLSRAVLVARPADQAWHFKGAAICQVGTIPCGHLVFSKGADAISVFSLPASADPSLRDGDQVCAVADGHPIAAFAKDGAIFCLVASGTDTAVSAGDLRQMRDRMESSVVAGPVAENAGRNAGDRAEHDAALAELLQPINP